MKDSIRISAIGIAIVALTGVAMLVPSAKVTPSTPLTSEEISWIEFCKARGYDPNTADDNLLNEFLDTWVDSPEEERAFNNLPAQ